MNIRGIKLVNEISFSAKNGIIPESPLQTYTPTPNTPPPQQKKNTQKKEKDKKKSKD